MQNSSRKKIILLGMMSRHPVAGMVWLTMQHVIGLQRLGYDVYYVEAHGAKPKYFSTSEDDGIQGAIDFLARLMQRFDMGQQWAFHGYDGDANCYGMSESKLAELYRSADLILNLHGGTIPIPEYMPADRMVYLGTDPVAREIAASENDQEIIDLFAAHRVLFTWGENHGNPDCGVPVTERFHFFPTRQPIMLDLWQNGHAAAENFTTIGSWKQWNIVKLRGEVYHWSKHFEFLKFIDLPSRTPQPFELALGGCPEEDAAMLIRKGWRVRHAFDFTLDLEAYTQYITASRGEFTVAKDQNVRLRSGWFSDRSACYLAAGRPVITQETGFSNILPTGEGLFAFSNLEEILQAVDAVNSDYERHSKAAREIAQDYFSYEVVLPRMLAEAGI
jgi:hypothetical protein